MPRYSFESDGGEREAFAVDSSPPRGHAYYNTASPTRYSAQPTAASQPDPIFQQRRANRRLSREGADPGGAVVTSPPTYQQAQQRHGVPQAPYYPPQTNITPGADNFGQAASGGVAGIAYEVAERNARDSGLLAMNDPDYPQQAYHQPTMSTHTGDDQLRPGPTAYTGEGGNRSSYSSMSTLNAAAVPMGQASPEVRPKSSAFGTYTDDPYQGYAGHSNVDLGYVDPSTIYDDGDDGLEYSRAQPRKSILGRNTSSGQHGTAAAAGGAAGAGAVMGALGGLVSRTNRDGSGQYDAVQNTNNLGYQGAGGSTYDLGSGGAEKSAWLQKQGSSARKYRWLLISGVGIILALAIALGVYFGIVRNQSSSGSSGGQSAADDSADNGDLNINSSEIQKLLNNKNLHKVFPGIDYTPINTQYPDCLANPPSQNNVTRDLAVLSQLTNTIRLYGTDCNQTEMLIHATSQLEMNDTIKIWMGVWQDNNKTTNSRQLSQMWDILDKYGDSPFKGVIVANEILYREQMTATELGDLLGEVRSNITAKGMSLPVATSDLGDDWTSELAAKSDYIMANIHPFFGGVNADDAASWTYSFWENNNGAYFKSDTSKNIIAETGWPSQGGTDCGSDTVTDCPNGSVAGIDEMNTFLSNWVCQALTNGTEYFWFESFDEPWKIMYDTDTQNWEDHWGLMDVNRNLKKGVTIPDCDGKTVDS